MGDMLQDGGNRWRVMLFRHDGPDAVDKRRRAPDLEGMDEFGIGEARMLGWWEKDCPVRTDREDVLASAYVRACRTLVALASWAPAKTDVRLQVDWKALGLDASNARLIAPEINDFQPARAWRQESRSRSSRNAAG